MAEQTPAEVYADTARVIVVSEIANDDPAELFEFKPCGDDCGMCACTGLPWPSASVRAAIDVAYAAGLAAGGSNWEYGFRIVYREGASVWTDGIGPVTWCVSEQHAREAGPAYERLECISAVTGRIEIVRRRPAGPVEVVPSKEATDAEGR